MVQYIESPQCAGQERKSRSFKRRTALQQNSGRWNYMKKYMYYLGVMVVLLSCLAGCGSSGKKAEETKAPDAGVSYEPGVDFVGAVKAVDPDQGVIEFYNTSFDTMETYQYTGGTQILSKNESERTVSEVALGEVYDVYTGEDGKKIVRMQQSADVAVHENASLTVDDQQKRLTVQGMNYAYTPNLLVFSEGKQIDLREITAEDEVTFYGTKGHAFSVMVTRGHGYIEPTNCKDFAGGTVTVQGEAILPASTGMLLVVPEGTRTLTMVNGDLTAEVSVQVKRNQVTKVDMAKYQSQMPDTARVRFDLHPQGAELYVNGALTDPAKPISLKYGNHTIKAVLEGYNEYSGILNVQDASLTVRLDLAEENAAEVESDSDSSSSVSDSDSDNDSSATSSVGYDNDHTITVSAPAGAAVYVGGTYKGKVPCSFTKILGSVTLTLTKENCETKSYRVELPDDSQDITWTFPDLVKK